MNNATLRAVASLSTRYANDILKSWVPRKDAYLDDWFEALDFFLGHLFYQGRLDLLSSRYYEAAKTALQDHFSIDRDRQFKEAWRQTWVPHDPDWTEFTRTDNPLAAALAAARAGKPRDQEMVLDVLRYAHGLPSWNVVKHSYSEVLAGRVQEHQRELETIWQVGPKTASFYLRDLSTLYRLEVPAVDQVSTQPIDTWVRRISVKLGIIEEKDDDMVARRKIVAECSHVGVSPSNFNAGAWYLGTHSLDVALDEMGRSAGKTAESRPAE